MAKKATIITGTVGNDAHVIGTKILSRAFRDAGFNVVELGCLTPPEEFIQAAQETAADAILMSSLYGMGEMDLQGFKDKCREAGLAVFFPPPELCTDNAAMIAFAGAWRLERGQRSLLSLRAAAAGLRP